MDPEFQVRYSGPHIQSPRCPDHLSPPAPVLNRQVVRVPVRAKVPNWSQLYRAKVAQACGPGPSLGSWVPPPPLGRGSWSTGV